jgi:hypothetical protein
MTVDPTPDDHYGVAPGCVIGLQLASRLTEVSSQTIMRWQKLGLIKPGRVKRRSGYARTFTGDDLAMITRLRDGQLQSPVDDGLAINEADLDESELLNPPVQEFVPNSPRRSVVNGPRRVATVKIRKRRGGRVKVIEREMGGRRVTRLGVDDSGNIIFENMPPVAPEDAHQFLVTPRPTRERLANTEQLVQRLLEIAKDIQVGSVRITDSNGTLLYRLDICPPTGDK